VKRAELIGDLFDSLRKILIVAVVLIVLFGSKKLPDAARSLGKSMRILKTEVTDLHGHEETPEKEKPAPAITSQQQVDQLQQQVRDLQAKTAAAEAAKVSGAPAAGTQHTPAS
jgi:sec-independent protein translocase protein TatA